MLAPRLLLFFAVLCAVVSITPLGDGWRFLVVLVPDWATVPNGVPFEAPHEQLARAIVHVWHGLVIAGANSGWWSDAAAAAVIADGFALGSVLQLLAAVLFVLALGSWAWSAARHAPERHAQEVAAPLTVVTPNASVPPQGVPTSTVLGTAERIAQLEIAVTNLLLKPDTQSVSEELTELSRQLRELSRALDPDAAKKS
jgi:hypothetical protein